MADTHKCWITDCEVQVPHDFLGCRPHWAQVPRELQLRVYATYRRRRMDDPDSWRAWMDAVDAARHAVEGGTDG